MHFGSSFTDIEDEFECWRLGSVDHADSETCDTGFSLGTKPIRCNSEFNSFAMLMSSGSLCASVGTNNAILCASLMRGCKVAPMGTVREGEEEVTTERKGSFC